MAVKDHRHDWVAKTFEDGSHAVGCKSCDYIGLVGSEAAVAKAVSTAQFVAAVYRPGPKGWLSRLLKR